MIYAIDFDGTLCDNKYPEIGEPKEDVIRAVKYAQESGVKFILWTCREGEKLQQAVEWCAEHGITFDAVNDNLPEINEQFGNNCRKVFADWYIDDRNARGFFGCEI